MAKIFEAFLAAGVKPAFGAKDQDAGNLWPKDREVVYGGSQVPGHTLLGDLD